MREKRRLPESEEDIMLVIWRAGGPVSASAILEGLERPLTASALHSYLKRLEEKTFLFCVKEGKNNLYTPLVTEEEYRREQGDLVLRRLYRGSLTAFAAALWDGGQLSAREVEQMRSYLDGLEEENR